MKLFGADKSNAFLKALAVLSSVLLVGGFVAYRAGAFDRVMATTTPPAEPDRKSVV